MNQWRGGAHAQVRGPVATDAPLSNGWAGDKKGRASESTRDESHRHDNEHDDMFDEGRLSHPQSGAPQEVRQSRAFASLCEFLGV
jgi:hypothetical protein